MAVLVLHLLSIRKPSCNAFYVYFFSIISDTFNEANKQLAYFSKTRRFNNSHCISAKLGKGMRKKKAPNRFTPNESSSEEDGCATQLQKDLDSSDEEESLIPTEPEVMDSLCRTKISSDQFKKGKQIKSPANIAAKRPAKGKEFE